MCFDHDAGQGDPGREPQREAAHAGNGARGRHEAWLTGSAGEALQAVPPYPSEAVAAWQVSRRLYANRTPDDESLITRGESMSRLWRAGDTR